LKISLVTVVYNAQDTIARCIESVINQKKIDLEYIIIDGGSTDNTLQIIAQYKSAISFFISEPDKGIYDAMNKGIKRAIGDIVGILNADDHFADDTVLHSVTQVFTNSEIDVLYGNLNFVDANDKIVRKWRSKKCGNNSFNRGFMPPHPTFYAKRQLFEKLGFYNIEYGSAADYELMVRFMHRNKVRSFYLDKIMVIMRTGGVSNKNLKNRLQAWKHDLRAMRENEIAFPLFAMLLKPLQKIDQFF
jgi:glycosyltransferase involved in cell wall biosynthesis